MLSMENHINKEYSSEFYYLHNLRRIRRYLSQDCLVNLIHAFVASRLDYCNSLIGMASRSVKFQNDRE